MNEAPNLKLKSLSPLKLKNEHPFEPNVSTKASQFSAQLRNFETAKLPIL